MIFIGETPRQGRRFLYVPAYCGRVIYAKEGRKKFSIIFRKFFEVLDRYI